MHEPEFLILDEPTSGLDPLVQQEFLAMVREVRTAGRTVLMSSHVLAEVEHVSDRVGIVRRGRLVAMEDIAALREKAVSDVLSGRATPQKRNGSTVVKVGQAAGGGAFGGKAGNRRGAADDRDQYVELAREQTDRIFVILAEFGDERDPRFPDKDTNPGKPGPARFDGPVHNQIPAPDRAVDNTTVWQADYNREHYQKLYFGKGRNVESVKTYYETQSSGRYSVDGTVTDWVKVRYNEARYGRSEVET